MELLACGQAASCVCYSQQGAGRRRSSSIRSHTAARRHYYRVRRSCTRRGFPSVLCSVVLFVRSFLFWSLFGTLAASLNLPFSFFVFVSPSRRGMSCPSLLQPSPLSKAPLHFLLGSAVAVAAAVADVRRPSPSPLWTPVLANSILRSAPAERQKRRGVRGTRG